jgi:hypothetical protein
VTNIPNIANVFGRFVTNIPNIANVFGRFVINIPNIANVFGRFAINIPNITNIFGGMQCILNPPFLKRGTIKRFRLRNLLIRGI